MGNKVIESLLAGVVYFGSLLVIIYVYELFLKGWF